MTTLWCHCVMTFRSIHTSTELFWIPGNLVSGFKLAWFQTLRWSLRVWAWAIVLRFQRGGDLKFEIPNHKRSGGRVVFDFCTQNNPSSPSPQWHARNRSLSLMFHWLERITNELSDTCMAQSMTAVRGPFEVQREQLRTLVSHAAGEPRTVSVDFHPTPPLSCFEFIGRFEKRAVSRDSSYDISRPREAAHSESGRVYWLDPG